MLVLTSKSGLDSLYGIVNKKKELNTIDICLIYFDPNQVLVKSSMFTVKKYKMKNKPLFP